MCAPATGRKTDDCQIIRHITIAETVYDVAAFRKYATLYKGRVVNQWRGKFIRMDRMGNKRTTTFLKRKTKQQQKNNYFKPPKIHKLFSTRCPLRLSGRELL